MEINMNLNDLFNEYRVNPCEITLTAVLKGSQSLIYGIIAKVTNHDQDSEDLTQEVLIKVIENINLLPKNANFGGWLNRTSLNTAINYYLQRKRIKVLQPHLIHIQEKKESPSHSDNEEIISIIYQHLSKLGDTEKSLVIDKHIHQMTYS